ncbi:hypothetical protein Agub_g726, partial [Astrephomene gubernaculifera]
VIAIPGYAFYLFPQLIESCYSKQANLDTMLSPYLNANRGSLGYPASRKTPALPRLHKSLVRHQIRALSPKDGPTGVSEEPAAAPQETPYKEILLQAIKAEGQTTKDILGETTMAQLKAALGEDRAGKLFATLDAFLAHRRLATLVFAAVDVALVWVLVKVFRVATTHE